MQLKFSFALAAFIFSTSARAAVLVNPPIPYPQYLITDTNFVIDYAGNSAGSISAGTLNTPKGYNFFVDTDSSTATGLVYVDVSSDKAFTVASGSKIGVNLVHSGGSQPVVLTGAQVVGSGAPAACVAGSTCFTDSAAAIYEARTVMRLSFTIPALCASGSSDLCTNRALPGNANNRYTASIGVRFSVVTSTATGSTVTSTATDIDTGSFTLGISDIAPKMTDLTCPANFYFPGDSQIYFFQSLFTSASANTGAGSMPGADIQYLLTMANEGAVAAADSGGLATNAVVAYAPFGQSQATIDGFTNTTDGANHTYDVIVQPQNRAGIIGTTANSAQGATCNGVQSQDIAGILKESKCFIATAAYHDGRAAPVMMLRKFRDQILSKFSIGQNFIKTYYHYSPAMAEWAWDKPIIRAFALKLLAPIELMAWAILKFSSAEEMFAEESYIDRLKKNLPKEEAASGSYSEQEKKKLESEPQETSPQANQPYVDRVKKQLDEEGKVETSSEEYSQKEKAKLPAVTERESPITVVKEGRDHKLDFGDMPGIHSAAGFKLGVAQGMQVTSNGSNVFTDVYGAGFQPELMFHYEYQLFHSENFGSFGLGTDFGLAYSGGKGLLAYGFNGSRASMTGFSFYQVPTLINGVYRFNLMRVIRPYVSAGAGAIFYTETRDDKKGDKRGYSAVYNFNLGASILLDFLDSGTHRDSYLSNGIQHTYLFLEYLYLNTLKSSVVFKRSGIYSGFLFEF